MGLRLQIGYRQTRQSVGRSGRERLDRSQHERRLENDFSTPQTTSRKQRTMKTNSAYSFGLLGYKTPTIDRMAKEGMTSARTPGRSFPASPTQRFFPRPTLN